MTQETKCVKQTFENASFQNKTFLNQHAILLMYNIDEARMKVVSNVQRVK